jgi:hypothetical protein
MSHWILAAAVIVTSGIPGLVIPARAGPDLDPGAHQTGPADCAKILWVGGYRVAQPGSCPEKTKPGKRKGYTDKAKQHQAAEDRERFRQERKAKHDLEKAKEKEARDARKAKDDHAKKCRGLGLPANCDLANPGKAKKK